MPFPVALKRSQNKKHNFSWGGSLFLDPPIRRFDPPVWLFGRTAPCLVGGRILEHVHTGGFQHTCVRSRTLHKQVNDGKHGCVWTRKIVLGVDSLSILFNHRSFQNQPFSLGFRRFFRKKDPCQEWGRYFPFSSLYNHNKRGVEMLCSFPGLVFARAGFPQGWQHPQHHQPHLSFKFRGV